VFGAHTVEHLVSQGLKARVIVEVARLRRGDPGVELAIAQELGPARESELARR
jgi:hypothetical protein